MNVQATQYVHAKMITNFIFNLKSHFMFSLGRNYRRE